MRKVLFVCSRNRLRSPTAEAIFSAVEGIEVSSAGTAPDAECPLCAELVEWADDIFVMERRHKNLIQSRFGPIVKRKHVVSLDIADVFGYMQPELIELLQRKVWPLLKTSGMKESE